MLVINSDQELAHFEKELEQLEERLAILRQKYPPESEAYRLRAAGLEQLHLDTAQAISAYREGRDAPVGLLHAREPQLVVESPVTAFWSPGAKEAVPEPSSTSRGSSNLTLDQIFQDAVECGATDIIIGGGEPPCYRIGGQLVQRGNVAMEDAHVTRMFYQVLTPGQIERLESEMQVDVSLSRGTDYRFRINLFFRSGGLAAVIRPVNLKVPMPDELGIPVGMMRLLDRSTGLVIVAGRTGTGKSTICASFLEYMNKERSVHIVTLEDPIEFKFEPKKAIISQREMREHAVSFESALKAILRQSPDVIYVGELRDMDTISATLSVAETGHLVLANLHTANATQTIHRIVDVFPPSQRGLINVQLSNSLTAVLCQALLPRADGAGLVAAREIMVSNPAIANLIRKNELHQIYSAMESGGTADMRTMERSLAELYVREDITLEVAESHAPEPESLQRNIERLMELKRGTPQAKKGMFSR